MERMVMMTTMVTVVTMMVAMMMVDVAAGEWAKNASNTQIAVSETSLEQIVPQSVLFPDGTIGTTWFELDAPTGKYHVRAQATTEEGDVAPYSQAGGVLISSRKQGPTLWGYESMVDSEGALVVVFSDRRAHEHDNDGDDVDVDVEEEEGGEKLEYEDVIAFRMTEGFEARPWGVSGMAVSKNDDFEPAPRVVERVGGGGGKGIEYMVVWPHLQRESPEKTCIRGQRMSVDGVGMWGHGGKCLAWSGEGEEAGLVSVVAGGDGDSFVLAFVKDVQKHGNHSLLAAAFDWESGEALWRTDVYTSSQVQLGYYPELVQGPGVDKISVAWCASTASNTFVTQLQVLDAASGSGLYPQGGVPVSGDGSISYLAPSLDVDHASQIVYVAYQTLTHSQKLRGIAVSGFNVSEAGGGAPLSGGVWSPVGWRLVELGDEYVANPIGVVDALGEGEDVGYYVSFLSGLGTNHQILYRLDHVARVMESKVGWNITVSDVASMKTRTSLVVVGGGGVVMTWSDLRSDDGWEVWGAGVGRDGMLGGL